MGEVKVLIKKDGSVEIDWSGFIGGECFQEAMKLYQQLKALGVNVTIKQVIPKPEAYQTTQISQPTKEVEYENGF